MGRSRPKRCGQIAAGAARADRGQPGSLRPTGQTTAGAAKRADHGQSKDSTRTALATTTGGQHTCVWTSSQVNFKSKCIAAERADRGRSSRADGPQPERPSGQITAEAAHADCGQSNVGRLRPEQLSRQTAAGAAERADRGQAARADRSQSSTGRSQPEQRGQTAAKRRGQTAAKRHRQIAANWADRAGARPEQGAQGQRVRARTARARTLCARISPARGRADRPRPSGRTATRARTAEQGQRECAIALWPAGIATGHHFTARQ
jgi:hypothetical protein